MFLISENRFFVEFDDLKQELLNFNYSLLFINKAVFYRSGFNHEQKCVFGPGKAFSIDTLNYRSLILTDSDPQPIRWSCELPHFLENVESRYELVLSILRLFVRKFICASVIVKGVSSACPRETTPTSATRALTLSGGPFSPSSVSWCKTTGKTFTNS